MVGAPKKVIFLDIDGVMNSHDMCTDHELGLVSWLDAKNVAILNAIAQATGAAVVVSSTWRLTMPFDELVHEHPRVGPQASSSITRSGTVSKRVAGWSRNHSIREGVRVGRGLVGRRRR